MPVKLRKAKLRTVQITDEAVALFRLCDEIIAAGQEDKFEDQGGRRREYLDANRALGNAVGIKFREVSPFDAVREAPPDYMEHNPLQTGYWRKAHAMRREMLAAMKRTKQDQSNAG
jgi:hypothetical protein